MAEWADDINIGGTFTDVAAIDHLTVKPHRLNTERSL